MPAVAGFLHSSPSVEGLDSRKDLETTYLEQVIAKPVFISLSVFLKYHTSTIFSVILSSYFKKSKIRVSSVLKPRR